MAEHRAEVPVKDMDIVVRVFRVVFAIPIFIHFLIATQDNILYRTVTITNVRLLIAVMDT